MSPSRFGVRRARPPPPQPFLGWGPAGGGPAALRVPPPECPPCHKRGPLFVFFFGPSTRLYAGPPPWDRMGPPPPPRGDTDNRMESPVVNETGVWPRASRPQRPPLLCGPRHAPTYMLRPPDDQPRRPPRESLPSAETVSANENNSKQKETRWFFMFPQTYPLNECGQCDRGLFGGFFPPFIEPHPETGFPKDRSRPRAWVSRPYPSNWDP